MGGLFSLLLLLVVAGCKSTKTVVDAAPGLEDLESFDPAPYPDRPLVPEVTIQHEIPAEILGTTSIRRTRSNEPRMVSGFRIQVSSHRVRTEANQALQQAIAWWTETQVADAENPEQEESSIPVYQDWEQPYWKIRIGNFRARQEATGILSEVRREFPGAFIVPTQVVLE